MYEVPINKKTTSQQKLLSGNKTNNSNKNQNSRGKPSTKLSPKLNPTRYGDWESKGRCIDF